MKKHIVEKGTDAKYGARPLRRAIQTELEDKLAEEMLDGNLMSGDIAQIMSKEGEIEIKIEKINK